MRLGVLDVGSNTVHLQVVDAHPGARPSPATNQKVELRLHEYLNKEGEITAEGVALLEESIFDAIAHAKEFQTEEILAFATSAIRDAKNGKDILDQINKKFEIDLQVLSGDDEAQMTFLAVRRWLGWSSGRLLVLDIGGGSLEIAVGDDERAEATISLPLGASRLTREYLDSDPHTAKEIKALETFVYDAIKQSLPEDISKHIADHFVATSKTFRTLARLGEHWFEDNPKYLKINSLTKMIPKLQEMSNKQRAELPGVSQSRARQIVAGAIVARTVMERLHINELEICPWALREGIVLRWLDWMER
ncbi:MAG: Ppx/GppA phosphatase family protein [Actinobacteria bacterium]|nr:Ppx/GppA phosphatase family protein [Actinomycetota bacterium]